MGEELKTHADLLENLDQNMDRVQEHMDTVNDRLHTIIKEVRAGDKLCMDIFCLLLLLGIIGIFIKVSPDL